MTFYSSSLNEFLEQQMWVSKKEDGTELLKKQTIA